MQKLRREPNVAPKKRVIPQENWEDVELDASITRFFGGEFYLKRILSMCYLEENIWELDKGFRLTQLGIIEIECNTIWSFVCTPHQ